MRFRLIYQGPLRTDKAVRVRQKQDIRRQLHPQLRELWERPPLKERQDLIDDLKSAAGDFSFISLVGKKLDLAAVVHITLLRAAAGTGRRPSTGVTRSSATRSCEGDTEAGGHVLGHVGGVGAGGASGNRVIIRTGRASLNW